MRLVLAFVIAMFFSNTALSATTFRPLGITPIGMCTTGQVSAKQADGTWDCADSASGLADSGTNNVKTGDVYELPSINDSLSLPDQDDSHQLHLYSYFDEGRVLLVGAESRYIAIGAADTLTADYEVNFFFKLDRFDTAFYMNTGSANPQLGLSNKRWQNFFTNNIDWDAGHLINSQTTAPTGTLTSTTLNDGTGSGAAFAVTAGSTDSAGSVTITAGNGTPGAGIAGQLVFNVAYASAPKMVMLTAKDADASDRQFYVSSTGTANFQISFNAALAASEVVELYYFVVQ